MVFVWCLWFCDPAKPLGIGLKGSQPFNRNALAAKPRRAGAETRSRPPLGGRSQSTWPKSLRLKGGTPSTDYFSHSFSSRKNHFRQSFHSCNWTGPGAWLQPRHLHILPCSGHTRQPALLPAIVQEPLQNAATTLAHARADQRLAGRCLAPACQPPSAAIFLSINIYSHNGNSQTQFVFRKHCASSPITQNNSHPNAFLQIALTQRRRLAG
jgi:hypothetical protein